MRDDTDEMMIAPARPAPSRLALWIVVGVVALAIAGYGFWSNAQKGTMVPVAVPAASARTAGAAIEHAGIAVEWRNGAPWVRAADSARASECAANALRDDRGAHPVASAMNEESVFLSGDAIRARRMAATMSAVEQMIEAQTGVARARVVLAEAGRAGAPGTTFAGATAAATITMEAGSMSQDLVDSVAALMCGALPGLAPDRVAIIDARTNRHRKARTPDAQHISAVMRDREEELALRIREGVPGAASAAVAVHIEESGALTASLVFDHAYASQLIQANPGVSAEQLLAAEESRVSTAAEWLVCEASATNQVRVMVTMERSAARMDAQGPQGAPSMTEVTPAMASVGDAVDAAVNRERSTPLGPGAANARSWDAGTMVLLGLAMSAVVGAAYVTHRKARKTPSQQPLDADGGELAELEDMSPSASRARAREAADQAEHEAVDASDSVRANPREAAAVLREWLDASLDSRVAHVVVALDSDAAGALLRALPANQVNRVSVALAHLRAPTNAELSEAAQALVDELMMAPTEDSEPAEAAQETAAEAVA